MNEQNQKCNSLILPERPARLKKLLRPMMGSGSRETFAYRRGSSAGANKTGYNNPYTNGFNHDDYIHGYLDAVELSKTIEKNKRDHV
jgi:hypothetical protein